MTAQESASRRSLTRNTSVAAGGTVVRGVLGFLTAIVFTRALSTSDRGIFGFITTWATLLAMVAGLGMPPALTRAKARGDASIIELYRASAMYGMVVGAVLGAAFFLAALLGPGSLFAGVSLVEVSTVAVLVPVLAVVGLWNVVAFLDDRILEYTTAVLGGSVLFLSGVAALAISGLLSAKVLVITWAISASSPLVLLLRADRLRVDASSARLVRRLSSYGSRTNVVALTSILMWRIDVFFVKGLRGSTELGFYVAAYGLAEIFAHVAFSARTALIPVQGSTDRAEVVTTVCRVTRLMAVLSLVVAPVAGLASAPLVQALFGARYAPAGPAVGWLLPGVFAMVLQGPLLDYLSVEGSRLRALTWALSAICAVNVVANLLVLRDYTFVAAAVISTMSYTAAFLATAFLFERATGCGLRALLVVRGSDLALVRDRLRAAARVGPPSGRRTKAQD